MSANKSWGPVLAKVFSIKLRKRVQDNRKKVGEESLFLVNQFLTFLQMVVGLLFLLFYRVDIDHLAGCSGCVHFFKIKVDGSIVIA